jgi:hypothetical protein
MCLVRCRDNQKRPGGWTQVVRVSEVVGPFSLKGKHHLPLGRRCIGVTTKLSILGSEYILTQYVAFCQVLAVWREVGTLLNIYK